MLTNINSKLSKYTIVNYFAYEMTSISSRIENLVELIFLSRDPDAGGRTLFLDLLKFIKTMSIHYDRRQVQAAARPL